MCDFISPSVVTDCICNAIHSSHVAKLISKDPTVVRKLSELADELGCKPEYVEEMTTQKVSATEQINKVLQDWVSRKGHQANTTQLSTHFIRLEFISLEEIMTEQWPSKRIMFMTVCKCVQRHNAVDMDVTPPLVYSPTSMTPPQSYPPTSMTPPQTYPPTSMTPPQMYPTTSMIPSQVFPPIPMPSSQMFLPTPMPSTQMYSPTPTPTLSSQQPSATDDGLTQLMGGMAMDRNVKFFVHGLPETDKHWQDKDASQVIIQGAIPGLNDDVKDIKIKRVQLKEKGGWFSFLKKSSNSTPRPLRIKMKIKKMASKKRSPSNIINTIKQSTVVGMLRIKVSEAEVEQMDTFSATPTYNENTNPGGVTFWPF